MKIKFIKEYRAFGDLDLPRECVRTDYSPNEEVDAIDEVAQWLIDNGFAEKVEEVIESGWKPEAGDTYYYVRYTLAISDWCNIGYRIWEDDEDDESRYLIGNVFKTEESAQRFIDYLEAVETVRHDEGFMKQSRKTGLILYGYAIARSYWDKGFVAEMVESDVKVGQFYFDTYEHARTSLEVHESEWKIIANYDWSRE